MSLLQMLCDCTPFAPEFWLFLTTVLLLTLLNVSAHRFFGRPALLLPLPTPHVSAACAHLRWSVTTHGLPISTSDCEPLPRCPSCWLSALLQYSSLGRSIQLSVLSVPSSADMFGLSSVPSPWATMFGRRIIWPGISHNYRTTFVWRFWNLSAGYKL